MTINEILKKYNLTRPELSKRYGIPIRTIDKWCLPPDSKDHRDPPEYVLRLIDEALSKS